MQLLKADEQNQRMNLCTLEKFKKDLNLQKAVIDRSMLMLKD